MDGSGETPTPKKRTRGPAPTLDTAKCAAALTQLNGNIAAVARRFKVSRSTVTTFIDNDPALKAVLSDAREGMLDDAEGVLYKAVKKGEAWAVCFFLKTQGRNRGYLEKQDPTPPADGSHLLDFQGVDTGKLKGKG
jgi:hypothetical protein